ncbi:hypothetical protein Y88_3530 [Novosphingobium nitrogenifigens DSM 19370]|uniref:Uncharacterized protein n=1 Tax=Novosphingobium nitrogenifigens DSM 19370 TaxID=983920 RepID=F1ZDU1_9SPHN|nr:hypothetical protein Y88_3530 [Novosphingobium nitrogenifigens DSM 19370]
MLGLLVSGSANADTVASSALPHATGVKATKVARRAPRTTGVASHSDALVGGVAGVAGGALIVGLCYASNICENGTTTITQYVSPHG